MPAFEPEPAAVAALAAAGLPEADASAALEACHANADAALLHATSPDCLTAGGAAALASKLASAAAGRCNLIRVRMRNAPVYLRQWRCCMPHAPACPVFASKLLSAAAGR